MEIIRTKEHWSGACVYAVRDNNGRVIAQCWRDPSEQNLAVADADRIAAMWDALRGFTTAEIKAGLDLAAINLALKANKAMLAAETARADKAEQQRDELLTVLEGLTEDIQGLIDESTGVIGLHLNGDIATWGELEAGGAFEWLPNLPAANDTIAKMKGGA